MRRGSLSSYKIKNLFSFMHPVPNELKSFVVYQLTWAGCNSRYTGKTSRHLFTRIKEHISTDKNSHIYKHFLKSLSCKNQHSQSCFKILDSANSTSSLKIKKFYTSTRLILNLMSKLIILTQFPVYNFHTTLSSLAPYQ